MDWYEFTATDTLFFRDGRPFSAGEEAWANSLFPPSPSVAYGALRSIYFGHNMDDFQHANKQGTDPSLDIRLRQMLLAPGENGPCFPVPADVLRSSKENEKGVKEIHALRLEDKPDGFLSSYPSKMTHLLMPPFEEKADGLFGKALLSAEQFQNYLAGDKVESVIEMDDYLTTEAKVGLQRGFDTRHATDGMLYKVRYRRPFGEVKDFGNDHDKRLRLLLAIEGQNLEENGVTKFGGDGKLATFKKAATAELPAAPEVKVGDHCRMYLATPAVFNDGWKPGSFFTDHGFQLLTAALGKGRPIGGWNMTGTKKNGFKPGPKPMRRTVPAGSVYYLKVVDETKASACIQKYHSKAIDDTTAVPDGLDRQGFGIVYFGTTKTTNQ